ncbi:hypothetical protein O181_002522 [Austropuccinia psidii MF-1]|uniref:Integrase catalytic domain-containing protein n=1 Tax=Austropuccinia psidii MF-1 TaxID=1389203 RepID=A0A9Q3GE18_9BASI|nr:hypothetical protein [Austropuccinia psidii MF-1]
MQEIIVDSGCSHHMTHNCSYLHQYENLESTIQVANGKNVKVTGKGIIHLVLKGKTVQLQCLHVPSLTSTLISIGRLCKKGYVFNASYNNFQIYYNSKIQMKGQIGQNGILYLNSQIVSTPLKITTNMSIATDINLINARVGHPGLEILQHMFHVPNKIINCDTCALSKSHRLPYLGVLPHVTKIMECVNMDLGRQVTPATEGGAQYYFNITDQLSHFKCIFLLKTKSEALVHLQNYCRQVFSLFGSYPINVVMDNGEEFVSNSFRN